MLFRWVWLGLALGAAALPAAAAMSRTVEVTTAESLARALAGAQPGDDILLADGVYRGTFVLARSGTAAAPITIRAQQPLRAAFDRTLFELGGSHGVLTNLVFERSQVTITGDQNRVAHSIFRHSDDRPPGMSAAVRILGGASHNRIHHNELTAWSTYGFRVLQPTSRTTGNRIDHNHIHDYSNTRSANEPEAIQVGSNNLISNLNVATLIERNLVERVRITGELLSLKTSGNVVRENTFIDIHGSVQARHGRNNTFLRNTLIGGAAVLRAYGDDHRVIGNRLVAADLIVPAGDVTQDALRRDDGTGGHPAARRQLVAANVVEDGGRILVGRMLRSPYTLPAENTTLAGNTGPVITDDPAFAHTGTRVLPRYDGATGTAVLLTRADVGPGAPDPLRGGLAGRAAAAAGWTEDFSRGMADWWVEGGDRVWVEDGRLHVWADAPGKPGGGVATVWCRRPLPDDFTLELEAHVVASGNDVNNINLFFCYADPTGRPLEETREARRTADYPLYHALNGYIITFVKERGEARVRIRRNPGFHLLAEHRGGGSSSGVTYRLHVTKRNGEIIFRLDGRELARATDPEPWRGGLFGLRTFRTNLWWDNIQVRGAGTNPEEGGDNGGGPRP
jgi:hypothetical protein